MKSSFRSFLRKTLPPIFLFGGPFGVLPLSFGQENGPWRLQNSIARAVAISPELRTARAEVQIRRAELAQAGYWPNPVLTVAANDKIGIDTGDGGVDVTQIMVSQPLPLGRLARRRDVAAARLKSAEAHLSHARLKIEYQAALAFHKLQLNTARLALAQERLDFAENFRKDGSGTDWKKHSLVRYLTPLDRKRLDIEYESAKQAVATEEGESLEAGSHFRTLLDLGEHDPISVAALEPSGAEKALETAEDALERHPALAELKFEIEAAQKGVALARARRFSNPTVSLWREKDILAGRKQDFSGIQLSLPLPLWDRNAGGIAKAEADTAKARAREEKETRNFKSQMARNRVHLDHLIEQARHYELRLLKPAREVFELTRSGFASGELNILALLDANKTYFDARTRFFELKSEILLEASELRLSAGLFLLDGFEGGRP